MGGEKLMADIRATRMRTAVRTSSGGRKRPRPAHYANPPTRSPDINDCNHRSARTASCAHHRSAAMKFGNPARIVTVAVVLALGGGRAAAQDVPAPSPPVRVEA